MRSTTRSLARRTRPVARTVRWLRDRDGSRSLTLIGWHRVDGETSDGLSTGVPDFVAHLDVLAARGCRVLSLEDGLAGLRAGSLPPDAVALTFDDGYASVVETAWPLLQDRGWTATLFVVTDSLDRELRFAWDDHAADDPAGRLRLSSADELAKAAADGLDLGSHTCTHPLLTQLDQDALERELVSSRHVLGDLLGRQVSSIAYPAGAWDRRVRAAAGRAGYTVGITVDRGVATPRSPLLSLPRAFVPHDPIDLDLVLDGAYTFLRPLDAVRARRGRRS
ncbi:polysaccharide deacetylase family protein [Nocardioides plantarum]|uniref:Polysaccharide deacetylase family protein n=1 Tax=Nocardioides plantarum TaxID=29299 RepID=A0ABV5K511_9ACTN|nr:polysaccharide deacetylase family protein [Nocardioides plantarum]